MNVFYQVASPTSIYSERIAIIFGFITLVFALAIFFSCRTFVSLMTKLGVKNLLQWKPYKKFYQYHLYYWWLFGIAVLAHVIMGTIHTGLPKSGDPDAGIHWSILILGAVSLVSGIILFFSCRIIPRLISPTLPNINTENKTYFSIFKYHSYYWILFVLSVAVHFIITFIHTGVWPSFH